MSTYDTYDCLIAVYLGEELEGDAGSLAVSDGLPLGTRYGIKNREREKGVLARSEARKVGIFSLVPFILQSIPVI